MKRSSLVIIAFLFCLTFSSAAYAVTELYGTGYGDKIGLLHLQYTTGVTPVDDEDGDGTPDFLDAEPGNSAVSTVDPAKQNEFYIGPRQQLYVPVGSRYYNPPSVDDTLFATVTDIGDSDTDACGNESEIPGPKKCFLHGFIWSDTIGWIALDGQSIQQQGFPGAPEEFPEEYWPAISLEPETSALLMGYAWSEKTGWIRLSSETAALFTEPDEQDDSLWGVWLDAAADGFTMPNERAESLCPGLSFEDCEAELDDCQWNDSESKCVARGLFLGRPLRGNAWNEKLGWIKFGQEGSDSLNFGVYTKWTPDYTPPELNLPENHIWFANEHKNGLLSMKQIASDPESGIDPERTVINVELLDSPDFAGCNVPTPVLHAVDLDLTVNLPQVGLLQSAPAGFCAYRLTGTVVNGAGLSTPIPPDPDEERIFYVRAGRVYIGTQAERNNGEASTLSMIDNADCNLNPVADGTDCYGFEFKPTDPAGNTIVPIPVQREVTYDGEGHVIFGNCDNECIRTTEVEAIFEGPVVFDPLNDSLLSETHTAPVIMSSDLAGGDISTFDQNPVIEGGEENAYLSFPAPAVNNAYPIQIASFAPLDPNNAVNKLALKQLVFKSNQLDFNPPDYLANRTEDEEFIEGDLLCNSNPTEVTLCDPATVGLDLQFSPALSLSGVTIVPGTVSLGSTNTIAYTVNNRSANVDIPYFSLDTVFGFGGDDSILLDVSDVAVTQEHAPDGLSGQTDVVALGKARYEVLRMSGNSLAETPFHDASQNYHDPDYRFMKDIGYFNPADSDLPADFVSPTPASVAADGSYEIIDILSGDYDPIGNPAAEPPIPPNEPKITIDRSDWLTDTAGVIPPNGSQNLELSFSAGHLFGRLSSEAKMLVDNYLAYSPARQEQVHGVQLFSILPKEESTVEANIKDIGAQVGGAVAGKQVFETGQREHQVVGTEGVSGIVKTMRDNVSTLARNNGVCDLSGSLDLPLTNNGDGTFSLPTSGPCVRADAQAGTVVAIYKGTPEDTLVIGDDSDATIYVPAGYRYTLIVQDGANIWIKNNLAYDPASPQSSLGLVLLAAESAADSVIGENQRGANLLIDPALTNVAATVYAEGSLLSYNGNLFYGPGAADSTELKNQLYWQGTITSRNTLGGAANPQNPLPSGVACPYDASQYRQACGQLYDFDYTRRFVIDTSTGLTLNDTDKFSGGGTCDTAAEACTLSATLPSVIKLDPATGKIDVPNSITATFYIEPTPSRPYPLGFTKETTSTRFQPIE